MSGKSWILHFPHAPPMYLFLVLLDYRLMSIKRRELFVGVLDNAIWTNEKLRAYLTKHASTNDDQYIVDCQIMSYNEARFHGKLYFNCYISLLHYNRKIICIRHIYG